MSDEKPINLLIVSDSHGSLDNVDYILKNIAPHYDALLFLGDGYRDFFRSGKCDCPIPFFGVRGNCDFGAVQGTEPYGGMQDELVLTFADRRILMTHGHKFSVKAGLERLEAYAAQKDIDIVLFGHTHSRHEEFLPKDESVFFKRLKKPMYLFNPGSLGRGYFNNSSFGTLYLTSKDIVFGFGSADVGL